MALGLLVVIFLEHGGAMPAHTLTGCYIVRLMCRFLWLPVRLLSCGRNHCQSPHWEACPRVSLESFMVPFGPLFQFQLTLVYDTDANDHAFCK